MPESKPTSETDPVTQILSDLSLAIGRSQGKEAKQKLVKDALERLRPLYSASKHLFTASVMVQIQQFKTHLELPVLPGTNEGRLQSVPVPTTSEGEPETPEQPAKMPSFMSVARVLDQASNEIRQAFPRRFWVKGEVSKFTHATSGHYYFDFVERTKERKHPLLPCTIWKDDWITLEAKLKEAGIEIASGQEMLFFGELRIYQEAGRLSFNVTDVFPEFTLGQIEMQRRAVLLRLKKEGLVEANKRHPFPDLPLHIALVSSRNSEGMRDFRETLRRSGYPFRIFPVDVAVQGLNVETSVCSALAAIAQQAHSREFDLVCIVRGGGSAMDLGWWNNYAICAAIARMPLPVVTGIGHQRDSVAADEVAHTSTATPTAAAELLCRIVRGVEVEISSVTEAVFQLARRKLDGQKKVLGTEIQSLRDQASFLVAAQQQEASYYRDQFLAVARTALDPHSARLSSIVEGAVFEPSRLIRMEQRNLGAFSLQVGTSAASALKYEATQAENISDQMRAHARRALDTHSTLLKFSTMALSKEPLRAVHLLLRTLENLSSETAAAGMNALKQAISWIDNTTQQVLVYADCALDPHQALLKNEMASIVAESSRAVKAQTRTLDLLIRDASDSSEITLKEAASQIENIISGLPPLVNLHLRIADKKLRQLLDSMSASVATSIRADHAKIDHLRDLVNAHDPETVLRRGFSITFDESGRAIKDATAIPLGSSIMTKLANGQLRSSVTEKGVNDA